MRNRFIRFSAVFALYVSLASPAHAYLDPATGSIIIQALVGAVGTALIYFRLFASRTKGMFKGIFTRSSDKHSGK